jgi:hypothetical protein
MQIVDQGQLRKRFHQATRCGAAKMHSRTQDGLIALDW